MFSFIDYEKKSNPIIQGLCAINSPVITQLTSSGRGRFLIPQGVSLMDKPGVLAAGLTDDFLRDHAIILSAKRAEGPQLFLSLSGVYGTYDEAETQMLNVVGRAAIANLDMFLKSPQNVDNFFAANSAILGMSEEEMSAHVQASIVLLREDTLRLNNGNELPFTLVSEVIDSKLYSTVPIHATELVAATPAAARAQTPQGAKTGLLIDFDADIPAAPSSIPAQATYAKREQTCALMDGTVREQGCGIGQNYEASVSGRDAFFTTVFAQSKVFTEQVKPKLDEFIQSFAAEHASCTSSDTKAIQDKISQIKKAFILNSGFATNEEQNASIICGLENYLTSNLYNLLFPIEKDKDNNFDSKVRSLWFVSAIHLDISEDYIDSFAPMISDLRRISEYRTPGNKFHVISGVCKRLYNLCSQKDGKACSTDDFLPCLIFVILKSNPGNLVSSLEYIQNCHSPLFLQKEALYYLTNVLSAVGFIQNISEKSLSIKKSVFDRLYSMTPPAGPPRLRPDLSAAYTFGGVNPEDLRIGDIPDLLEQYKELLEYFVKTQQTKM